MSFRMPHNTRVAVLGAMRTPIGRFGGCFKNVSAPELAAVAIRSAVAKSCLSPGEIEQVILGNVLQAGIGPNPARRAAVLAGLPYETSAFTINKVCGSGLKAIALGADAIRLGRAEVVVAGGMESMSCAPHLISDLRWGKRIGETRIVDSMLHDALWDCFYDCHMADTVERLAVEYRISRAEQDEYACESQQRCAMALKTSRLCDEIAPVLVAERGSEGRTINCDENPRPNVSIESLSDLAPAFSSSGTITPGNASSLNDGAAVLVLASDRECERRGAKPLAWIGADTSVGVDPMRMGIGPAHAIRQLVMKEDRSLDEYELLEINEAFAAQVLAVCSELQIQDRSRLNVNGGAIAMGHPVGASGARIIVSLIHEMIRRQSKRGLAATCIGGGMGVAMELESA